MVPWLLVQLEAYVWLGALLSELHVALAVGLLLAGAAWAFHQRWLHAAVCACCALLLLAPLWPLLRPIRPTPAHGPSLRVAQLNLAAARLPAARLTSWLTQARVQLASLTHLAPQDVTALKKSGVAGHALLPGSDGAALLVVNQGSLGKALAPGRASVRAGRCDVEVSQLVLPSRLSAGGRSERERAIASVMRGDLRRRSLYVGWLGSRSAASDLRALLEKHELRDARLGHGYLPTAPAWASALGLPLSHVLVHGWLAVPHAETQPALVPGAERGLLVTLELTEPRCRSAP